MDSASPPSHFRAHSEAKRSLRSPLLPETSAIYRLTPLPDTRPSLSPPKLSSRSYLLNDSGSDMFKVISERKETTQQLRAMENRIKSLQLAEAKAKRKLQETKKITEEKTTLMLIKQKEQEEKQQWRESLEAQRLSERSRIEKERMRRRQNLQYVRESTLESNRVALT